MYELQTREIILELNKEKKNGLGSKYRCYHVL